MKRVLKPFAETSDRVGLEAEVKIQNSILEFQFYLDGFAEVQDFLPIEGPRSWVRADELWKSTCFEVFLGRRQEAAYWEFNFSPHRQGWNVYRFAGYRDPQPPRRSEDFELIGAYVQGGQMKFELRSATVLEDLECGLTAVIKTRNGISYYAVKHAGATPDFHDRRGFVIQP